MTNSGFFATGRDYQLPHPPIDVAVLLVIHSAICRAFSMLRSSDFPLASAPEDRITQELHWVLEDHLRQSGEVPGFDQRIFQKVIRAPEIANFDGRHPAKKPDLMFELARDNTLVLSSQDALFIECKIVAVSHPLTTVYCNDGLSRFVNGDYAWAMQDGMMIGYVRCGNALSESLSSVMSREPYHTRLGRPSNCDAAPGNAAHPFAEELHYTIHERNFEWPHGRGPAQEIRIYHSWHSCS